MSAIRNNIFEAYAIDKEKDKVGPVWLEKTVENYCKGKSLALKVCKNRRKSFDDLFYMFSDGRDLSNSRVRHYHVLQRLIHRYEVYVRVSMPRMGRYVFDIHDVTVDTLNDLRDYIKNGYTKNWPFTDFEMPKEEYGTPIIMTLDEVETLYRTPMPTKVLEEQRDIFVFQCNVGCRVGDMMSYTKQSVHNGALEYIAAKTLHFSGRTFFNLPLREHPYGGKDEKTKLGILRLMER